MEVIIIITKEVADETEATTITNKLKNVLSGDPQLNDRSIRVISETRNRIE